MKKVILFFVIVVLSANAYSQDPNIVWQNKIGGPDFDWATDICATSDGGFIIGGLSFSNSGGDKSENGYGEEDYWVVKVNSEGIVEWDKTIGGNDRDWLNSIIQTSDGGYLLAGDSRSDISGNKTEDAIGSTDYWIVKLDSIGNFVWDNTLGGTDGELLQEIRETNDGGFIMVGRSDSNASSDKSEDSIGDSTDYWVVKVNSEGTLVWENTIGGTSFDYPFAIAVLADGNFVIGGYSSSSDVDKTSPSLGGTDGWLVKLDANGAIIWDASFGGGASDRVYCMENTSDGGFLINSYSDSPASGDKTEDSDSVDFWAVKLDSTGELEWENTINANSLDLPYDVIELPDGNFFLGGYSLSDVGLDRDDPSNGGRDAWLIKLDPSGNKLWDQSIGGSSYDDMYRLVATNDGGIVFLGSSESPVSGDIEEAGNGDRDFWIVKYNAILDVQSFEQNNDLLLSPNPVENYLSIDTQFAGQIDFSIYSILGAQLKSGNFFAGLPIDVEDLESGIYLISLTLDGKKFTNRFIKL